MLPIKYKWWASLWFLAPAVFAMCGGIGVLLSEVLPIEAISPASIFVSTGVTVAVRNFGMKPYQPQQESK